MKSTLCSSLLVFALYAGAQQGPATVIKTETRMVLVDAVVTDKSGNYVRDLTAKDFHVWEDNKEQTVQTLSRESDPGKAGQPAYTVLFFNNALLDNATQFRARQAAAQYIQANAGPKNLIAVADFTGSLRITQTFTADANRLIQAVESVQSAEALGGAGGGPVPVRNSLNAGNLPSNIEDGERRLLNGVGMLARNLAGVPGRKTVVLFSGGLPHDNTLTPVFNTNVNLCNRFNVSIYPVEGGGLVSPVTSTVSGASTTRQPRGRITGGMADVTSDSSMDSTSAGVTDQLLHMLARATGGYVNQNTNDFGAMLTKVVKEENEYYLIGYTPAEAPEGSCHSLKVKVDRGGADLRARTSYCNVKPIDLLAGKPMERDLENRVAGAEAGNVAASMQLPFFYRDAGEARLNVSMELPSAALKFEKVKGKFHSDVNVLGIAYSADGVAAARFSDTVNFDFANQKDLDVFHAQPMHYEKQFGIAPGKYTFKVVFRCGADAFGKLEAPLAIDPYDGKQFMLSALALSKEMHPASDVGTTLDSELLEGRTPLVFRDVRVVPAASNQFKRTDPGALYLEIYEPLATEKEPPSLEIKMRVVDKKTGEEKSTGGVRLDSAAVAGNAMVPYGLKIKLDTLQPGQYRADVQVGDSAGKIMMRSVEFEVK